MTILRNARTPAQRALAAALLAGALASLLALGGCSLFRSRSDAPKSVKCSDPKIVNEPVNRGPLKVPDGMDPPNTVGSVVIPPLNEPAHPRAPTDPCLTSPPDYGTPDSGKS
jgi:hypothetical protein